MTRRSGGGIAILMAMGLMAAVMGIKTFVMDPIFKPFFNSMPYDYKHWDGINVPVGSTTDLAEFALTPESAWGANLTISFAIHYPDQEFYVEVYRDGTLILNDSCGDAIWGNDAYHHLNFETPVAGAYNVTCRNHAADDISVSQVNIYVFSQATEHIFIAITFGIPLVIVSTPIAYLFYRLLRPSIQKIKELRASNKAYKAGKAYHEVAKPSSTSTTSSPLAEFTPEDMIAYKSLTTAEPAAAPTPAPHPTPYSPAPQPSPAINAKPLSSFPTPASPATAPVTPDPPAVPSTRSCPQCGAELPAVARFCNKCGFHVT